MNMPEMAHYHRLIQVTTRSLISALRAVTFPAARFKIGFIARRARVAIIITESPAAFIYPFAQVHLAVPGVIPVKLICVQEVLEFRISHPVLMRSAIVRQHQTGSPGCP